MKTNFTFRLLPALLLALCLVQPGFGQTSPTPPKVYSEVYYHKIKPGHTMAEARADYKQFYKEMSDLREAARQEIYYLMEFTEKAPSGQAKK